jgi:heme oxygenase
MDVLHLIKVITAYKHTVFSRRVKLETKANHDAIEQHPFVDLIIKGKMTDLQYAAYLSNVCPVYDIVEKKLLAPQSILARTNYIRKDVEQYSNFLNTDLSRLYVNDEWVQKLESGDELDVLAAFYIRWLGDLYGGQILAKNIRFNSALKFKSVRLCIKVARELIELNASKNTDVFIERIKNAYADNYNLAEKLRNLPALNA